MPRVGLPRVNFAGAYNLDRYDTNAASRGARRLPTLQGGSQPAGSLPHLYTKVVSTDLDEDKNDLIEDSFPSMPGTHPVLPPHDPSMYEFSLDDEERRDWLACVDGAVFQGISGLIICMNALLIGLETDIKSYLWWWTDQFMLSFFTIELILKICRHGCAYFNHEEDWIWNYFDLCIVGTGIFDQWFMQIYYVIRSYMQGNHAHHERSKMTVIFMLLRMARLLRIVRLFRLIKIVRPLYELAQGILEALQGMFWVLIFMMMTLYATAMLCTLLIGEGEIFTPEVAEVDSHPFQEMFRNVETSLFALFGTMSSWSLAKLVPLFKLVPFFRVFFVIFYIFSAWALLAIMTGVVSENMIAIREQMLHEEARKENMRKAHIAHFLSDAFERADDDRSGQISRDEFDFMIRSKELARKLVKYSKMEPKDLEELFDWIDHDNSGTINRTEFMEGFKWINEPLRAKSLVKVFQRLGGEIRSLRQNITDALQKKLEEVTYLLTEPMRKVHIICDQMQNLDSTLGDLAVVARQPMDIPTEQELRTVEERLSQKLKQVCMRLEEVEKAAARDGGTVRSG